MKDSTAENTLLKPEELARALQVSLRWVFEHSSPSSKNPIPVKRVGRLLRFDLGEVMQWIDKQQGVINGTSQV
jgi:predicted DNA-binding transcriptional regulator AlpA